MDRSFQHDKLLHNSVLIEPAEDLKSILREYDYIICYINLPYESLSLLDVSSAPCAVAVAW